MKKEEPEKKSKVKAHKEKHIEVKDEIKEETTVNNNSKEIEAIIVRGEIDILKVSQLR